MSIGDSGRIVLEVDPGMKRRLYAVLAENGLTLKAWFIKEATAYIEHNGQRRLFDDVSLLEDKGIDAAVVRAPDASA